MLRNGRKPIADDFVILDSQFPQKVPRAFRNSEINEYFRQIENARSYAMFPMKPGRAAWFRHGYGVTRDEYDENVQGYLAVYPQNESRVRYLDPGQRYLFKLAYSFFLAETYVLLPFLERNRIPFTFVLYPGGAFGLDNPSSDAMLKRVLGSKYFRGVIVTQSLTRDYLLGKKLCAPDAVHFVYGGFSSFTADEVRPRKNFPVDKLTFDLCFTAAKYSERGVDKGYDLFIAAAKLLYKKSERFRFHVVGGFDETDIPAEELGSAIQFYGYRNPDFLVDFYSRMDIALSPNRPNELYPGNFDGFPLSIDAAFCGVAMFASDPLNMNQFFTDREDIVIVPTEATGIADAIWHYFEHPEDLSELARRGGELAQRLFAIDSQVNRRIDVFETLVDLNFTSTHLT